MAGLSICTHVPLRLNPGEWALQYTHTSELKIRTEDGEHTLQLQPSEIFILPETSALKFLAMIQHQHHPTLLNYFRIVEGY